GSLLLSVLIIAQLMLSGCGDDETVMTETTVLSFGPAGVKHGEDIVIIGTNLTQVTAVLFQPSVEVTDFKEQTASSMTVTVPDAAEPGTLILKTADQEIETKTILNFEVPVDITSISASVKPGEEMTITGDKLNWVESITFPSDIVVLAENFSSQTLSEIKLVVPEVAQSGFLTFRTGGTEPLIFASATHVEVATPQITALNPSSVRHESNLTIEGDNLDLVTEVVLYEGISIPKSDFVSQTATAIELTVPAEAKTGIITLKQAAPQDVVSPGPLTIILPAGTTISPEQQRPGIDAVTIAGTDLDLIASLELPSFGTLMAADFTSSSPTEIVFDLPAETSIGIINYTTIHGYSGSLGLAISIPSSGLSDLLIPCYVDAVAETMGQGGGWGDTVTDFANPENPREGTNAMKVTYVGSFGGGGQLGTWGKDDLSVAGAEVFAFSIFGGAGTGGQQLNLNVKSGGDNTMLIDIAEGEWIDYQIPLADLGSPAAITEIWFQDQGWSGTVYIDRMGFDLERATGPAPLTIVAFDDAIADIFGQGGGWGGGATDFDNSEVTRAGEKAIKITSAGDFGGLGQLGTCAKDNLSIAGLSTFAFSLYGGAGTEGQMLNVNVKLDSDNPQLVTIKEGEWVDIEIPLSSFGNFTEITEIWFQDQGWTGDVYIDHVGFR
ncbi:MAG: hypothetical protein AAFO69_10010, partial [Bacteroidota bacterium]